MREQGFILIMTLLVLSIALLFIIAALDNSIVATELMHYQQARLELFEAAEATLKQGEYLLQQDKHFPIKNSVLLSDQQLLDERILSNKNYRCIMVHNAQQKYCYLIEAVKQLQCYSVTGNQPVILLYYRVTARASNALFNQSMVILQSTDVVLLPAISRCQLYDQDRKTARFIYAGRQSWREIYTSY